MELARTKEAESITKKKEIKQRDQALRKLEKIETLIMKKMHGHLQTQREMIDEIESGRFKERHQESLMKPSVADTLLMPSMDSVKVLNTIDEVFPPPKRNLKKKKRRVQIGDSNSS